MGKDERAQNPGWIHPVSQRRGEMCVHAIKMTRLVCFLCSVHIARHRFFPGQRDFRYASSLLYNLRGGRRINLPMEYKVAFLRLDSPLSRAPVKQFLLSRRGLLSKRADGGGVSSCETIFHNKFLYIRLSNSREK